MSAGFYVNGQCLDSTSAPAVFASIVPPAVAPGTTTYHSVVEPSGSGLALNTYATTPTETALYSSANYSSVLQPCDTTETFFDGVLIGWGIVAAMIAAWLFLQMRRAL